MRAIEAKIIKALRGNEGTKKLSCHDRVVVKGDAKEYYLWDNLLIWQGSENNYYFSGRGWSSSTTKSRLDAILSDFVNARIIQRKWMWYLIWNDKQYLIDTGSIFMFKGNSLYRLAAHEEVVKPL